MEELTATRQTASMAAPRRKDWMEVIFNILSSVKLGVCVLLSCALFFALSTIFWQEPEVIVKHVPAVKYAFEVILVFLCLNLFAVTLSRYPWSRLKIGMLITHAGLIVTFTGAFITTKWGVDGMLTLQEGEKASHFFTGRDLLRVKIPDTRRHNAYIGFPDDYPVRLIGMTRATERDIRIEMDGGDEILIDQYYPRFRSTKVLRDGGPRENPSIEVEMHAGGQTQKTWLQDFSQAGPAIFGGMLALAFVPAPGPDDAAAYSKPREPVRGGRLRILRAHDSPLSLEVLDNLGTNVDLGSGYTLRIEKYFPHLLIGAGNKAENQGDEPVNPAIQIRVTGKDFDKSEWIFPEKEAPPQAGRIGLDDLFAFGYDFPERFTFAFLLLRDAGVDLVLSPPNAPGTLTSLSWNAVARLTPEIEISVLRFFKSPHMVEEPSNDNPNKSPAMHVIWKGKNGGQDDAWIPFGATARLNVGGNEVHFEFTQQEAALPFEVQLADFRLKRYEGTDSPASFESLVKVKEADKGEYENLISMNNPLKVTDPKWPLGTWKVFQSSYDPNTEATSTFSVSYDPGRPMVYTGFIAVCTGVFFMFWVKPLLKRMMKTA